MIRFATIRSSEAAALFRLANGLHVSPDPASRKRRLLEGLCELLDGYRGSCIVTHANPVDPRRMVVSSVEYLAPEARELTRTADADTDAVAVKLAAEPRLASVQAFPDSNVVASVEIHRSPIRPRRFLPRHQALVDLFHKEMAWIYQTDVLLTSANAQSLSPRARQTLQHLLAGLSEKQIASRLRLSPNTVHHYVKSIHRHFRVSSRSELLARWVGLK